MSFVFFTCKGPSPCVAVQCASSRLRVLENWRTFHIHVWTRVIPQQVCGLSRTGPVVYGAIPLPIDSRLPCGFPSKPQVSAGWALLVEVGPWEMAPHWPVVAILHLFSDRRRWSRADAGHPGCRSRPTPCSILEQTLESGPVRE